jgi:hypothetical protein
MDEFLSVKSRFVPKVEIQRRGDLLLLLPGTFTVAEGQGLTAEKQLVAQARFQRIAVLPSRGVHSPESLFI